MPDTVVSFIPKARHDVLKKIEKLDALKDHQHISFLSAAYDFPWETQRAYELALLRTFAVPKSSALLVATQEFTQRTQKRYDDTTIIISTIGLCGYDSPQGRAAIRRMNQIHSHYKIPNDEYLYVLSTFLLEPIRWIESYGWRKLSEKEKQAGYYFWREVGKRMNIKDIPASLEAFETYNRDYEKQHFAFHPNNKILADASVNLFLGWYLPKPLWSLGKQGIYAIIDKPMREAFGYPEPALWAKFAVQSFLNMRARVLPYLPPRKTPYTLPPTRTYPAGYKLEEVGPT